MKTCRICKTEKMASEFYAKKDSRDGLRHECKKCFCERTSNNQKNNPEGHRRKAKKWRSENPEKLRDLRRRIHYPKHKSYYAEKQREERKLRPHLFRARLARRRAAKLNATPPWVDHSAIAKIYERAAACGMQVDHIIPLQGKNVCGLHVPWNLQLLTETENQRKGNKIPECFTRPATGATRHDDQDISQ